ncbi:hypothetical protein OKW40_000851 [Paraburkholderia sp. RAU6.4a]|uniref:hypothetical protein n=1 Tax=Paraburkholderia sp. RAU6.4a TaxID=2991067 RepID=UPI003D1E0053
MDTRPPPCLFEMVAWLECGKSPDLCAEELRARIEYARVGLTRLEHELAIGNLDTGDRQPRYWRNAGGDAALVACLIAPGAAVVNTGSGDAAPCLA